MSTPFLRNSIEKIQNATHFLGDCLRDLKLTPTERSLISALNNMFENTTLLIPLYDTMLEIEASKDWSSEFRMYYPQRSQSPGADMSALLCVFKGVHATHMLSSKDIPDGLQSIHSKLLTLKSQIDFIQRSDDSTDHFSLAVKNVQDSISLHATAAATAENLRILGVVTSWIPEDGRSKERAINFFETPPIPDCWTVAKKIATEYGVPSPEVFTPEEAKLEPLNEKLIIDDRLISTVWITTNKLGKAELAIARLADNAKKMGLPPPTLSLTGNTRMASLPMQLTQHEYDFLRGKIPRMRVAQSEVVITGQIPRFKGVRLLAQVDHEPGGPSFVMHTSNDAAQRIRDAGIDVHNCDCNCDHCNTKRERKTTFFVEDASGVKQIGSTCVDKFLGTVMLPQFLAALNNYKLILKEFDGDEHGFDKSRGFDIEIPHYLAMAKIMTDTYGFIKTDSIGSTRDTLLSMYYGGHKSPPKEAIDLFLTEYNPDENNPLFADAEVMIKTFLADTSENDYIVNLKKILSLPYINLNKERGSREMKFMGLLASVPEAYRRRLERLAVNQANPKETLNEPFASAKERGPLKLMCLNSNYYANREFPSTVYNFADDLGRLFRWSASGFNEQMEAGKYYQMTATIKDHKEYNGVVHTLLNRCQDFELVAADAPMPDFSAGAKVRKFKETNSFVTSIFNQDNDIDGDTYAIVSRNWRENDNVHDVHLHIPTELIVTMTTPEVIQRVAAVAGVQRDLKPARQDKAFSALIDEELSKLKMLPKLPNKVMVTSDVMGPILPATNKTNDTLSQMLAHPSDWSESKLSDPAPWVRQTTVTLKNPKLQLAPSDLISVPIEEQLEFRDKAFARGTHALAHASRDGSLIKMEPLALATLKHGQEINILENALNSTCHDTTESRCRRIYGYNEFNYRAHKPFFAKEFVVIRGCNDTPEQYELLLNAMKHTQTAHAMLNAGLMPELLSSQHKLGSAYGPTLNWLNNAAEFGEKKPLVFAADEAARIALKEMGALVTTVCIGDVQLTNNRNPEIQLPALSQSPEENEAIMQQLAERWQIHNTPNAKIEQILSVVRKHN